MKSGSLTPIANIGVLLFFPAICIAGKTYTQQPEVQQVASPESDSAQATQLPRGKETPKWIWSAPVKEHVFLRKRFRCEQPRKATLLASCDNKMTIWLNGHQVAESSEWQRPVRVDVSRFMKPGENEILVDGRNAGGVAAFVARLAIQQRDGTSQDIVSDKTWQVAESRDAQRWIAAREYGKLGVPPWGNVFTGARPRSQGFEVLPGFQIEKLFTVPKAELGSWVSITFDNKGRLIASDQGNRGLCRVTPPPIGSDELTKVEQLDVKITSAHGLLYAFGSLYISVNGGPGSGFYRARDTNGDDQYDEVVKLKTFAGGGEHGPHSIRLSPDGKSLYVIAGNHTNVPLNFSASRLPSNWSEDLLLPRQWDARGHARGRLAPGGWIAKTDPNGEQWEIMSSGYRNPFDMDFNADGELFAYDADMEWDFGTPWYRPTRVVHATSGSEFGWRSGTGKWPTYFIDSLPPVVDMGPGSPVGVTFGYGSKFPAKYQQALYLLDWTFGTMYAIHLTPDGASYRGVKEEFLSRSPLPLTDVAIGPDGAMYFTVGGRGTQSELFRVTYVGPKPTTPSNAVDSKFASARSARHRLEALHHSLDGQPAVAAIDLAWSFLGNKDRHLRYAARLVIEHQDPVLWQHRVLGERRPPILITAAVAFARQGNAKLQTELLTALQRIDPRMLSSSQLLDLLRTYSLVFIRMGRPEATVSESIEQELDPLFPTDDDQLNRELSRVLIYLRSPTVISKSLKLLAMESKPTQQDMGDLLARNGGYGGTIANMLANQPEIEKIHLTMALRNLRYGWTLEQRRAYFEWLLQAKSRSGGASYQGFIDNIRKEAVANLLEAEKRALDANTLSPPPTVEELPTPKGPGRKWFLEELVALTRQPLRGRDFENGKRTFAASRCVQCHRFGGLGGATGPDLTNVAGRFSYRDLAEAIVDPSKVISDQYRASVIETTAGKVITGRITSENDNSVILLADPVDPTKTIEIAKNDIEKIQPSRVSLMPMDLLDTLNEDEVLDLLAYMMSRGNPNAPLFK
jgi:putative heme-binding domain-containing protein